MHTLRSAIPKSMRLAPQYFGRELLHLQNLFRSHSAEDGDWAVPCPVLAQRDARIPSLVFSKRVVRTCCHGAWAHSMRGSTRIRRTVPMEKVEYRQRNDKTKVKHSKSQARSSPFSHFVFTCSLPFVSPGTNSDSASPFFTF